MTLHQMRCVNSRIHRGGRRAITSCRRTFEKVRRIRDFLSKAVARHHLEYVSLTKKKVSAQAYPRKFVHLVYLYIHMYVRRGWVADTTRASKLQFFFVPVSFFLSFFFFLLTQVRQVKVVFLRTLRNEATHLPASDRVNHIALLRNLQSTGLDSVSLKWLFSYLTGLCIRTKVNSHTSTSSPLTSAVPQGCVLGSLLFLIFDKDVLTVAAAMTAFFADDALFHPAWVQSLNFPLSTSSLFGYYYVSRPGLLNMSFKPLISNTSRFPSWSSPQSGSFSSG